ncbi:hypothetical protein CMT41_04810 [Colwellia sp. MT41]|uniref:DNA repair ATPase n=1 Tax=Colwellia marinimaniae TaxID=1513592 RepID=A0ABQ0MQW7_9GAMM|nr:MULTISPECIES: FeoB-associated Cys-rich membrane protein [Colwellia]ALO34125.1 hypothetical protein CMT41_04810 [Colwellia sp. MT41]GAW94773.1 DNA repair ATPase [Colwellia marinimaniae]
MIAIIVGLIIALIVFVVVVTSIQQHKEKIEAEKRIKVAKQKAIIDENEELIFNLANLPSNPTIVKILNRRSLNAAKTMQELMPEVKGIKKRAQELKSRLKASEDLADNQTDMDDSFILPDNEQQLVGILQCIKKLRVVIKSEQSKGALDAQTFTAEDQRLAAMQLKINIESLIKRGSQAFNKEMLGSARQYFEKALQTLINSPVKNDYVTAKHAEISQKLEDITDALKHTNAKDAAKKAKSEESELDILFQPKKKW